MRWTTYPAGWRASCWRNGNAKMGWGARCFLREAGADRKTDRPGSKPGRIRPDCGHYGENADMSCRSDVASTLDGTAHPMHSKYAGAAGGSLVYICHGPRGSGPAYLQGGGGSQRRCSKSATGEHRRCGNWWPGKARISSSRSTAPVDPRRVSWRFEQRPNGNISNDASPPQVSAVR